MTKLVSDKVTIRQGPEIPYYIVSEFDNFKELMPGQIIDWKSDKNTCSFKIQGMTELNMKYEERVPDIKVVFASFGKNPFDFKLSCLLEQSEPGVSVAQIVFDADLNPMLEMVAKRPLNNLLNMIAEKLKTESEKQG